MIFDRYIGRRILLSTSLVLLVLLAIDVFFALVREFGDIGKGLYSGWHAIQYVALTIPRRMIDLFSMATLLGSLLALGAMVSSNELTVLRSSGVSLLRIIRSVLQVGFLMFLTVAIIGEWVAPASEQLARMNKAQAQTQQITYKSVNGIWVKDGGRFVNIRKVRLDGRLSDVHVYEFNENHQLVMVTQAEHVLYADEQWILENVRVSEISDEGIQVSEQEKMHWGAFLDPLLLSVLSQQPNQLSSRDLWAYVGYLDSNNLDSSAYQLAFWKRIVMPFSGMVMLFLAVPFVFGPLRRVGMGQRVLVGVLIGVFFYVFSQMVSHVGQVSGLSPMMSAFLPSLLFIGMGLWMMKRIV